MAQGAPRGAQHIKCVLPETVADYDPVINFEADGMTDGRKQLHQGAVLLTHCGRDCGHAVGR